MAVPLYATDRMAQLLQAFSSGREIDYPTVMTLLAVSENQARRYLAYLYGEELIHVTRWERTNRAGSLRPVYAEGSKPDEPHPRPASGALRAHRNRRRHTTQQPSSPLELAFHRIVKGASNGGEA